MQRQSSPWRIVADRQCKQSIQREKDEIQYKKYIKRKYMEDLTAQMKYREAALKYQKQMEKSIDRIDLDREMQNYQKNVLIEKTKNSFINQQTSKVDRQNHLYEALKKEKQRQLQQLERQNARKRREQSDKIQMQENYKKQQKKQQIREFLKETMEDEKKKKKQLSQYDRELARQKLKQHEEMDRQREEKRKIELQNLKERAKKVDYGSHEYFQNTQNKTLLQKKVEQWSTYKDSLEKQEALKQIQKEKSISKKYMEYSYKRQLQNQISQRQRERKVMQREQLQHDRKLINQSQNSLTIEQLRKRNIQNQRKKQLHSFLEQQEQEKKRMRQKEKGMQQRQLKMNQMQNLIESSAFPTAIVDIRHSGYPGSPKSLNRYSLDNPQNRSRNYSTLQHSIPVRQYKPIHDGNTFGFDDHRLRQLQILQKSFSKRLSPQSHNQKKNLGNISMQESLSFDRKKQNYFASKGLSVFS